MKVYVVPLFFRLVLVSILLGSVWRDVRCISLNFLSDSLDSTLMRFEAGVGSSLSEKRPAIASFSVVFVAFLAFAAAMTATFLSLIFLRLSFNFACLAFCLARIRVQHEKKMYIAFRRTLRSALRDRVTPSASGCVSAADMASTLRMSSSGLNSIASSCMRLRRAR